MMRHYDLLSHSECEQPAASSVYDCHPHELTMAVLAFVLLVILIVVGYCCCCCYTLMMIIMRSINFAALSVCCVLRRTITRQLQFMPKKALGSTTAFVKGACASPTRCCYCSISQSRGLESYLEDSRSLRWSKGGRVLFRSQSGGL